MSDTQSSSRSEPGKDILLIAYVLYLLNIAVNFLVFIGVVMAYTQLNRPEWLRSHAIFLIRTFWISLLVFVLFFIFAGGWIISIITRAEELERTADEAPVEFLIEIFAGMGPILFVGLAWVLWYAIRSIIGLVKLIQGEPIANPRSWLFG